MLERSVISILFASNSRRGSWWRNHGSGMVEMQTRMGEEGEERKEILAKDNDAFFEGRKKEFASLATNAQRISLFCAN